MAVDQTRNRLAAGESVVARLDLSGQRLTLGGDDAPTVLDVEKEQEFVGAPEIGPFEWGESRSYVVLTESGRQESPLVFDPVEKTATLYDVFVKSQRWRSRKGSDNQEFVERAGLLPASTATIRTRFFKLVDVDHVDNIALAGLRANAGHIMWFGYSAGTQYLTRDLKIAAASWLGTTEDPGELMKPEQGVFATLMIEVSTAFRDAYLRDVRAVLQNRYDKGDNGDTVLAFSPVPPQDISFAETQLEAIGRKSLLGQSFADMPRRTRGDAIRAIEDSQGKKRKT